MIKGKNLILKIKSGSTYYAIAASKSCTVKVTHNPVEVVPSTNWQWREFTNGKQSWEITASGLVSVVDTINKINANKANPTAYILKEGEKVNVSFEYAFAYYRGDAYITALSINATNGKIASYSITLQGTGPLSGNTTPG